MGVLPYGKIPEGEEMDSLMNVVFVYPGKPNENDPGTVTDMLSLIFSDTLDIKERQRLLEERYKIKLDLFSLMSVFEVTDYVAEAREEGYEDGMAKGKAEDIVGMMKKFGCTLEEALEVANVSDEDRDEILALVRGLQKQS